MTTPSVEVTRDVLTPTHISDNDDDDDNDYRTPIKERVPNVVFDLTLQWIELPSLNRGRIQWMENLEIHQAKFRISGQAINVRGNPRFYVTSIMPLDNMPLGMVSREVLRLCKALKPLIADHTGAQVALFGPPKVHLEPVAA